MRTAIGRTRPAVFEPLADDTAASSATTGWSSTRGAPSDCCLPEGATRATLDGQIATLAAGRRAVFEEVVGPRTGEPATPTRRHRHAVRLTEVVRPRTAVHYGPRRPAITRDRVGARPTRCRSRSACRTRHRRDRVATAVATAWRRATIVLVDHGRTVTGRGFGERSAVELVALPTRRPTGATPTPADPIAGRRFAPSPSPRWPVSGHDALHDASPRRASRRASRSATSGPASGPAVALVDGASGAPWEARAATCSAADADRARLRRRGRGRTASAHLRFGDDAHGARPPPARDVHARPTGSATAPRGNVGAERDRPRRRRPARPADRRRAQPAAGRRRHRSRVRRARSAGTRRRRSARQERAVTADGLRRGGRARTRDVQRAAATFRWTGSWHTVFVTVDPPVGDATRSTRDFERRPARLRSSAIRMAGYDLESTTPRYVPLEIELTVCVEPDYFRADVKQALLDGFSSRVRPTAGAGSSIPTTSPSASRSTCRRLVAAASEVDGRRVGRGDDVPAPGHARPRSARRRRLEFGRLEIARLDNDPSFPERGVFSLTMEGGK